MHKKGNRGGSPKEHLLGEATDIRLRNWQGARVFLEVVRRGSFRAAAQTLNVSANTLRREIEEFEHEIGITLLTRHVDGVRLTAEGEYIVSTAQRMESAAHDIARVRNLSVAIEGEVRLGITEGLGTFWIAPRLVEFRRAYPGLLIDMRCAMHPSDVLRLETDVGIQITPPTAKDLRITKIGRLHVMPFAAPTYLDMYGTPRTLAELSRHQLVIQVSDQISAQEMYLKLFPQMPQVGHVAFKSNVSSAHYSLIARGSGIGALPTYAAVMSKKIVPIDIPGLQVSQDIWLVYHADAARLPRVRRLIDWVIASFSPKQYPWFADEFIHPRDLPEGIRGVSVPDMVEAFDDFLQ
jgi:DNA-binding transcriptional LysR family regulator